MSEIINYYSGQQFIKTAGRMSVHGVIQFLGVGRLLKGRNYINIFDVMPLRDLSHSIGEYVGIHVGNLNIIADQLSLRPVR